MKKLLIVAGIIVAVVVIAIAVVLFNLNGLVARGIEKAGSDATQTNVRVAGVKLAIREGRGSIEGLTVANPAGFKGTALTLDGITIALDVKSVRENPIVISEISIRAPVVAAEFTKAGSSNIEELRNRIESGSSRTVKVSSGGKETRIRIDRFVIEKGRLEIDPSALGLEKRTIDLPEIRLENVGGASGAYPAEIGRIIASTVMRQVSSQMAGSEINSLIEKKLGKGSVEDKAKGLIQKLGG